MKTRPLTRSTAAAVLATALLLSTPTMSTARTRPAVGTWATAGSPSTVTVAPNPTGGHHLTYDGLGGYRCTYPDIRFQVESRLRSARVDFTGNGYCTGGKIVVPDSFLIWTSSGGLKVGAHGVYRVAVLRVCLIAAPHSCDDALGAIGLGAI
jgi:hypothetical protein